MRTVDVPRRRYDRRNDIIVVLSARQGDKTVFVFIKFQEPQI